MRITRVVLFSKGECLFVPVFDTDFISDSEISCGLAAIVAKKEMIVYAGNVGWV